MSRYTEVTNLKLSIFWLTLYGIVECVYAHRVWLTMMKIAISHS